MRFDVPGRLLTLAVAALALLALGACDGGTTEERIEEAREEAAAEPVTGEPEPADLVKRSEGSFELTLTGDLDETVRGVAVCTEQTASDVLRVAMQIEPPGDRAYVLEVPGYARTAKVQGDFQISGARRSAGPTEVAVARVPGELEVLEPGLALTFRGTYAGAAGNGEVEGSVDCPLPDGEE